jgi:tetratricopeptide (TPR) repeat protein
MTHPRLIALLLALVTLLVYLPVRQHGFVVYDDPEYLTDNHLVQAGLTWPGIRWAFTTWHVSNWHPLTWLSHMADCELFGLQAGAHHLVNVLLHAANTALLFVLLWRLTGGRWAAAMVAALFAWHPLRVESVAWISERKDVLSVCFALLTLLAYERYAHAKGAKAAGANRLLALAVGLFALGLLAKPMLVTLPFVLLLLDWWPLKRLPEDRVSFATLTPVVWEKWPFFLLTAASCVVTFLAQRAASVLTLAQCPPGLRFGNALLAYGQYLRDTFWPADLALLYPLPASLPLFPVAASVLALVLITWLAWREHRTQPWLLVGWLWFLGTLVPVIGLVQVGLQSRADRYTYLPQIGLFIAVVFALREFATRRKIPPAWLATAASAVLLACLGLTSRQIAFWRDSETLFTRSLKVSPGSSIAHINLGVALQQQGRRTDALAEYQAALRLDPASVQAHNNLAILLEELDRNDEALAAYQRALQLNPLAPLAHCNLGLLLAKLGRFDEALAAYAEAARLAPRDARPPALMGRAELQRGNGSRAAGHFRTALKRNSEDLQTMIRLARLLATSEDAATRNGAEALTLAQRATEMTGGEDPVALDTLAMALAETGRFAEARQAIQRALELVAQDPAATVELKSRLQLYAASRPFREGTPPRGRN